MNLIIVDDANKKFQFYISVTEEIELFIRKNINAINRKNNSFYTVQNNVNLDFFKNQGYIMDHALFDSLIINYNGNLMQGEEQLSFWKRT